ncbi:MAG: elongation factor G [Thermoguttaceae bacterium]|nr:elongation factor G [Thermoguttaceae bacterium]
MAELNPVSIIRNIGIAAHIDSGKTTLSERILFYAGRIHRMNEISEGAGATMDSMDLERERGITIQSAATTVHWKDRQINLIDTPGHVDFTVEVERSLRVLDGAVLVLCAVGGVQPQSLTIDRQMRRYKVPRLAFINKMDRTGANPFEVVRQLHERLACNPVMMEYPIGKENDFQGVVDLITREAIYFDGANGEKVRREPCPENLCEVVEEYRGKMLESLSMFSDDILELLLSDESEKITNEKICEVIRSATQAGLMTPVYMGTAYKNKGVQPLLDAVVEFLPAPTDTHPTALEFQEPHREIALKPDSTLPTVAMAFKIVEDPYGTLVFMRIYQGAFKKGEQYYNQRTGNRERFGRIVRIHADERMEIEEAGAGEIVAIMGLDCASGDTFCSEYPFCTLQSMYVPEPVIQVAITPKERGDANKLGKALQRFRREDPTLIITTDQETSETIMSGMGELHLEVYVERIRREYKVDVEVSNPRVNYREAPTQPFKFDYRYRKQTGGSGQYAHIVGELLPLSGEGTDEFFLFEEHVVGGRIPRQYIPAIEKGVRKSLDKGPVAGFPIVNLHYIVNDGSYHEVDSSDMAFQICAQTTIREYFPKTKPCLLEPVMKIAIECPQSFQGSVVGDLSQRRGVIMNTEIVQGTVRIEGEVPLAETFGYMTDLRSITQGQGTFLLMFSRYRPLPAHLQDEVILERKKQLSGK